MNNGNNELGGGQNTEQHPSNQRAGREQRVQDANGDAGDDSDSNAGNRSDGGNNRSNGNGNKRDAGNNSSSGSSSSHNKLCRISASDYNNSSWNNNGIGVARCGVLWSS